jgi:hypothetical protein
MKKKQQSAIPDFARAKPKPGTKTAVAATDKAHHPDPRQPQKAPTKSRNGGRRGA